MPIPDDSLTKRGERPAAAPRGLVDRLDRLSVGSIRRPGAALLSANMTLVALGIWMVGPQVWWTAGREAGLMTVASVMNLTCAAFLCDRIHRVARKRAAATASGRRPGCVWRLMLFGFCFLALDDGLALHEKVEHAINAIAVGTGLDRSDWIDDALVAFYGVAAAAILWRFREELAWLWPQARWLAIAGACFVNMVALDVASGSQLAVRGLVGRDRVDLWLVAGSIDHVLTGLLGFMEEVVKLALGMVTVLILLMTYRRALEDN